MCSTGFDLDAFKDVPGFKGILKAVLKSQIQLLVQQLSQQAGEESLFLSANVTEGNLSFLGSNAGKNFIQDNDGIRKQFLGYCLQGHKQKTSDLLTPYSCLAQSSKAISNSENTTSFAMQRKPYLRMSRRTTRIKSAGKPFTKILQKPSMKTFDGGFVGQNNKSHSYLKPVSKVQEHSDFHSQRDPENQTGADRLSEKASENSRHSLQHEQEVDENSHQEAFIKAEPLEDTDQTEDVQYSDEDIHSLTDRFVEDQSTDISMETEESLQGEGASFEYVLDPERSGEITPWKPEENKANHISSKRKQTLPTRIKKTTEAWNQNENVPRNQHVHGSLPISDVSRNSKIHLIDQKGAGLLFSDTSTCQKPAMDYLYSSVFGDETSRVTQQNFGGGSELSTQSRNVYGSNMPVFPSTFREQSSDFSKENAVNDCQVYDNRNLEDKGSNINWTEESMASLSPNSGGKSYAKTPLIDGQLVTRGEGRYEKLIKCEECGKVCRTSNMARHKKRYCNSIPKEIRRKQHRSKEGYFNEEGESLGVTFDESVFEMKSRNTTNEQKGSNLSDSFDISTLERKPQTDDSEYIEIVDYHAEEKGGNSSTKTGTIQHLSSLPDNSESSLNKQQSEISEITNCNYGNVMQQRSVIK